jgi:hypothetical protein
MNFFRSMLIRVIFIVSNISTTNLLACASQPCDDNRQAAIMHEVATSTVNNKSIKKNGTDLAHAGIKSDLEAALTIAELQEILLKINEDLDERIDDLEHSNKQEIADALKERKKIILQKLKELQGFEAEMVNEYLARSNKHSNKKLLWFVTGLVVTIAVTTLLLSSYDPDRRVWTMPSKDLLNRNFWDIVAWVKCHVPWSAQQPQPTDLVNTVPVGNGLPTPPPATQPAIGQTAPTSQAVVTTQQQTTVQQSATTVTTEASNGAASSPLPTQLDVQQPVSSRMDVTPEHVPVPTVESQASVPVVTTASNVVSMPSLQSATGDLIAAPIQLQRQTVTNSVPDQRRELVSPGGSAPSSVDSPVVSTPTEPVVSPPQQNVGRWDRLKNWAGDVWDSLFGGSGTDDLNARDHIAEDVYF